MTKLKFKIEWKKNAEFIFGDIEAGECIILMNINIDGLNTNCYRHFSNVPPNIYALKKLREIILSHLN